MFRSILLLILGTLAGATVMRLGDYLVTIENDTLQSVVRLFPSPAKIGCLNLTNGGFSKVDANAFASVNDILILSLQGNNLEQLPESVFMSLSDLQYLSLANNRLRNVHNVFIGLHKLFYLDIRDNGIIVLEPGTFLGLNPTRIINIYTEGNDFGVISNVHFSNSRDSNNSAFAKGIRVGHYNVVIENNTLKSVVRSSPSANKMGYLYLLKYGISRIEADAFATVNDISILSLGSNNLKELPQAVFKTLSNLRYLSLANNKLRNLQNVFLGLDKLAYLDMTHNDISVLEPGSFLGLNPWKIKIEYEGNDFGDLLYKHFIDLRAVSSSIAVFDEARKKYSDEEYRDAEYSDQ